MLIPSNHQRQIRQSAIKRLLRSWLPDVLSLADFKGEAHLKAYLRSWFKIAGEGIADDATSPEEFSAKVIGMILIRSACGQVKSRHDIGRLMRERLFAEYAFYFAQATFLQSMSMYPLPVARTADASVRFGASGDYELFAVYPFGEQRGRSLRKALLKRGTLWTVEQVLRHGIHDKTTGSHIVFPDASSLRDFLLEDIRGSELDKYLEPYQKTVIKLTQSDTSPHMMPLVLPAARRDLELPMKTSPEFLLANYDHRKLVCLRFVQGSETDGLRSHENVLHLCSQLDHPPKTGVRDPLTPFIVSIDERHSRVGWKVMLELAQNPPIKSTFADAVLEGVCWVGNGDHNTEQPRRN